MFKMGLASVHRGSGVNRDVPLYVRERTTQKYADTSRHLAKKDDRMYCDERY